VYREKIPHVCVGIKHAFKHYVNMEQLSGRLREERERRNLSVRECSAATKIREPFLQALERGDFAVMSPVYVRSFVRTYGSYLGIDADELSRLLNTVFEVSEHGEEKLVVVPKPRQQRTPAVSAKVVQPTQPSSSPPSSSEEQKRRPDWTTLAQQFPTRTRWRVAILVVVIVAIGLWLLLREGGGTNSSGTQERNTEDSLAALSGEQDSIILTAVASDTVWLTITGDGFSSSQVVMMPGDEGHWSAMEKFNLSIGNAGGVTFFRNGVELAPLGKRDEAIRSVIISRNDIRKSSDVWRPPTPKPASSAQPQQSAPAPSQSPTPVKTAAPARMQQKQTAAPSVSKPQPRQRTAARRQQRVYARVPRRSRPMQRPRSIPEITPAPTRPPQR